MQAHTALSMQKSGSDALMQADSSCQLAPEDANDDDGNSHSIAWLKWTGAAVLFLEALIVSLPLSELQTSSHFCQAGLTESVFPVSPQQLCWRSLSDIW